MEYLKRILGIQVIYIDGDLPSMPNYIYTRYRLEQVRLDGKKAVFVYPKVELDAVNAIKKHMERMEIIVGAPTVLILNHLDYRQKEYLIRDNIPFIVEGKQIYLPFMAVYLQERYNSEKKAFTTMLPSAQLLFLYYIYNGRRELLTSDAAKALSLTATSLSRASRQLEEMNLLKTEKRGVQKVVFSDKKPKELFESAKSDLMNPVKRTIYVPKSLIKEKLLMSSYSALSDYSMINPETVKYLATDSISKWEKKRRADCRIQMNNMQ